MRLMQIERHPSRRQLTIFGIAWLVFFGAMAAWAIATEATDALAWLLATTAIMIPLIGWWHVQFLRHAYIGLAYATYPIGVIVSVLILAAIYYLILTPIGIAVLYLGNDPMRRCWDYHTDTYWTPRNQPDHLESYFRQF